MADSQHYTNARIEDMDDVRRAFEADWKDEASADELNWLFVGTSGVHGTATGLDAYPDVDEFTVLIVRPRTVSCLYGHVEVDDEDVAWLRERIKETIEAVHASQVDNLREWEHEVEPALHHPSLRNEPEDDTDA